MSAARPAPTMWELSRRVTRAAEAWVAARRNGLLAARERAEQDLEVAVTIYRNQREVNLDRLRQRWPGDG